MATPELDDLNEMAALILPSMTFDQLGPEARIQIIQLVNQSDMVEMLSGINDQISSIEEDTRAMGEWFKKSRLWEGH